MEGDEALGVPLLATGSEVVVALGVEALRNELLRLLPLVGVPVNHEEEDRHRLPLLYDIVTKLNLLVEHERP